HVGVGAELVVHGRLDRVEDRLGDLLHHGGEDEVLVVRVRVLLVTVGVHPDHGNTVFFRSGLQRTGSNGSGNGQDDVGALGDELLGGVVTVLHVGEVAGCGTVLLLFVPPARRDIRVVGLVVVVDAVNEPVHEDRQRGEQLSAVGGHGGGLAHTRGDVVGG